MRATDIGYRGDKTCPQIVCRVGVGTLISLHANLVKQVVSKQILQKTKAFWKEDIVISKLI